MENKSGELKKTVSAEAMSGKEFTISGSGVFDGLPLRTFSLGDLAGRTVAISLVEEGRVGLVYATDTSTGDLFAIEEYSVKDKV